MARKKKNVPSDDPLVQIVHRVPTSHHKALQEAMGLLKVDMSNLLRMMISEHVGEYIARGKKGAESLSKARAMPIEGTPTQREGEEGRRHLDL